VTLLSQVIQCICGPVICCFRDMQQYWSRFRYFSYQPAFYTHV